MRTILESADRPTSVQHALTWTMFLAAASVVAALCVAMLRPFASVIAWSAVLAILCYPLQQRLVRRTGRVALSAFITSVLTVLACVVPLLVLGGIAVHEGVALGHSLPRGFQAEGEPGPELRRCWRGSARMRDWPTLLSRHGSNNISATW